MSRDRDIFWDVVKGICIIAVILIHTTSRNSLGGVIWRQFINFPVAMFFFVAGYFCHGEASYGVFVIKKTKRLLVPLAVASIVYGSLELYFGFGSGNPLAVSRIFSALASFPLGWGYFVLALFQCMLLAPMLQKVKNRSRILLASFALYLVTALYMYLASTVFLSCWTLANSVPVIFCTAWLPLFVLGLNMQKRRLTVWAPCARTYGALVFLLAVAVVTGIYWYDVATIQLARSQIRLPCILLSFVLAALLPNLGDRYSLSGRWCYMLARLGEMSFFVYLWHRFVLLSLRSGLPQFAEWHFAFVIVFFILFALLLPHSWAKRLWWIGM